MCSVTKENFRDLLQKSGKTQEIFQRMPKRIMKYHYICSVKRGIYVRFFRWRIYDKTPIDIIIKIL
jgi:hypothetical protein